MICFSKFCKSRYGRAYGHVSAAIKAVETVDICLGEIMKSY